jgi:hypothetical protein
VLLGWALFRADDLGAAGLMLAGMAGVHGLALGTDLAWLLEPRALLAGAVGLIVAFTPPRPRPRTWRDACPARAMVAPLFVVGVARALADAASPFLYFQF